MQTSNAGQKFVMRTKKLKSEISTYVGTYMLDKIARSAPARMQMATVPLSLAATLVKSMVQFLILYRLATGVVWIDTVVGLGISAVSALFSPFFLALAKQYEGDFVHFTHLVVDRAMEGNGHGIEFLNMIKNRIVLWVAFVCIVVLWVVEVNSAMLIRIILEYLVTFWVTDQVNLLRDSVYCAIEVSYVVVRTDPALEHVLTKYDYVAVVPPKPSHAMVANTWCPCQDKVTHVNVSRLKKTAVKKRVADTLVTIIEDWKN